MSNINSRLFFSFVTLCFLFSSCKVSKNVTEIEPSGRVLSSSKVISSIIDNSYSFSTLFVKKFDGKLEFGDNKFSFKGAYYIQKDSQIIMSIMPVLGIELFKISFTPSQLTIIDKTKKQVLIADIDYLKVKFGVDVGFKAVQSILTNSSEGFDPACFDFVDCLKSYKFENTKDGYEFKSLNNRRLNKAEKTGLLGISYFHYVISNENFRIKSVFVKNFNPEANLTINYANFDNVSNFLFPLSMSLNGESESKKLLFTISISQAEFNSDNKLTFKIPDKFEKVILK